MLPAPPQQKAAEGVLPPEPKKLSRTGGAGDARRKSAPLRCCPMGLKGFLFHHEISLFAATGKCSAKSLCTARYSDLQALVIPRYRPNSLSIPQNRELPAGTGSLLPASSATTKSLF